METNSIHSGNCFDALPDLAAASVHACVTDPPYGLAFMGRDWDDFEPKEYQEWCEEWARAVKRVLKPGGHLLAFSGNRTHHRLFTGVEDAGFEIRETLTWHYGSGFPKASDISKTIDKRADAEREVVGEKETNTGITGDNYAQESETGTVQVTDPATDAAKRWDGWKTGLKPATEFVVMARKPFDGATVDCVLEHGTGALHIDGCRVDTDENLNGGAYTGEGESDKYGDGLNTRGEAGEFEQPEGRYPANVVFDETEAERLDREVGELDAGAHTTVSESEAVNTYSDKKYLDTPDERTETESGGPSRYFYTSKASKSERTENGQIENKHPTVKPQDLMEWLVKLVTREGQTVLDPFAGSGTTCKAAKDLGREFIGIEQQAKYADIARARVGLAPKDPTHVRGDDAQRGIGEF